jgi:hypothetical protein
MRILHENVQENVESNESKSGGLSKIGRTESGKLRKPAVRLKNGRCGRHGRHGR